MLAASMSGGGMLEYATHVGLFLTRFGCFQVTTVAGAVATTTTRTAGEAATEIAAPTAAEAAAEVAAAEASSGLL